MAALGLAHFGSQFSNTHMPASFKDTGNAIGRKAFLLKDMPLLVDDLHPTSSPQEKKRMDDIAQSIARMWGDRAGRGRLRSDLTMQEGNPPRGIGIMTGEDLPKVYESGLARYVLVSVKPGDVSRLAELTELQHKAKNGELAAAMRTYVEWLLPQGRKLPGLLCSRFEYLRSDMKEQVTEAVNDRQHDNAASLMLGFEMFLSCAECRGDITSTKKAELAQEAMTVLVATSEAQKQTAKEESPVRLFLETLGELITTKSVQVVPLIKCKPDTMAYSEDMVGYRDKDFLYLLPGVAYAAVSKQSNASGEGMPLHAKTLWKRAAEQGYVEPDSKGNPAKLKKINGTPTRLLWFQLDKLRDEALISFDKPPYDEDDI